MRGALAVLVAAAAVAAAAPSPAGAASCSQAGARAAIAAAKLRLRLIGPDKVLVSPSQASRVLCFDLTRDGKTDMAVSIASGGTAGDIGFVVFVAAGSGWKVALTGAGYKLGIRREDGDLVTVQPVYNDNDPNCCPTGGFDHTRYHWNGKRFVVARTWHTKTFRPS